MHVLEVRDLCGATSPRLERLIECRGKQAGGNMNGRRRRQLFALLASALLLLAVGVAANAAESQRGEVHLAMVSPLTGPLSFVGVDNRAGVEAAIREINARGGVRGRRIRLQIFDDNSQPSQGVIHMQRIAADDKFVGVIGSGFSSVGLAVASTVEREKIPYISMASSAAQVTPAKPYYYMTTATSRLFAYSMAIHLRKAGVRRIALMTDNGGVGGGGGRDVEKIAPRLWFLKLQGGNLPLPGA